MSATKSYNRKYYRDNRAELLADRRRRYQEDVEYRGRVKQQARSHYHQRRNAKKESEVVAVERKLFPISMLAKAIKRKVETVRDYHKKGILKDSYYKDSRGWRMYTRDQILALVQIFSAFDNPENFEIISLGDVKKKVSEVW